MTTASIVHRRPVRALDSERVQRATHYPVVDISRSKKLSMQQLRRPPKAAALCGRHKAAI